MSKQTYDLKEASLSIWYDIQNKYSRDGITEQELEEIEQAYEFLEDTLTRAKELKRRKE